MHRRVEEPVLTWRALAPAKVYRIQVRDEDTGIVRNIHEGAQTTCRLPSDLRETPNQLTYRLGWKGDGPKWNHPTPPLALPRIGDDYETPAPDLITAAHRHGVSLYRFIVTDTETGERLVEMCRPQPRFLLPPGRLSDRRTNWDILSRSGAGWSRVASGEVTAEMIGAARLRAETEVEEPGALSTKAIQNDARRPPGRPDALSATVEADPGPIFAPMIDAGLRPELSRTPDGKAVVREQWLGPESPLQTMLGMLEGSGFRAMVFLDVFGLEAMGLEAAGDIVARLTANGHTPAMLVRPEPWRAARLSDTPSPLSMEDILKEAKALFHAIGGEDTEVIRLVSPLINEAGLFRVRQAGVRLVILAPEQTRMLPQWMKTRAGATLTHAGLAVATLTRPVSVPAHPRDLAKRHVLGGGDALLSGSAEAVLRAAAEAAGRLRQPILAGFDSLRLMGRDQVHDAAAAQAWNAKLEEDLPNWDAAGWTRNEDGYPVFGGVDKVGLYLAGRIAEAAKAAGFAPFDFERDMSPAALRRWTEHRTVEPLVRQHRADRSADVTVIRAYDAAFQMALAMEEGA